MHEAEIKSILYFVAAFFLSLTCILGLMIVCVEFYYFSTTHSVPPGLLLFSMIMQGVSVFVSCLTMIYFLYMYFKHSP